MTIVALRILPPFAIGRVGSASEPLDNYTLAEDPKHPLAFRRIQPARTLAVDEAGKLTVREPSKEAPEPVLFKKDRRIRPVAPFLEVWAVTDDEPDLLQPLTLDLLKAHGGTPDTRCIEWCADVANRKVVRRTEDDNDIVAVSTGYFTGHAPRPLDGTCPNFISASHVIRFGQVQFVQPASATDTIRLRFTPGTGAIYGPEERAVHPDQRFVVDPKNVVYDRNKGTWVRYGENNEWEKQHNQTLPESLYAIYPPAPSWQNDDIAISRGYLDDTCDGFVAVRLQLPDRKEPLTARARICSAPPAPVPDAFFVRTLADDLEQLILGPEVPADEPLGQTRARAEEILRRAYETVRFLNVALMNGNAYKGRDPLDLDTMPELEAAELTERPVRPVMAPGSVDTLAIMALHQSIFAALRSGAAQWFAGVLRKPEEAADFTDRGRRKMPALMIGADENYLALTYRQIDTITKAVDKSLFGPAAAAAAGAVVMHVSQKHANDDRVKAAPVRLQAQPQAAAPEHRYQLAPRNLSAQIHYKAEGNPASTLLDSAIANCCPGLETDFRAVWRRIFKGIVLREYDNLVMAAEDTKYEYLIGHRLLKVDDTVVVVPMIGPNLAEPEEEVVLTSSANPYGVQPLEWSNVLGRLLKEKVGGRFEWKNRVTCQFTREISWEFSPAWIEGAQYLSEDFDVRPFFEDDTAVISGELAHPGELTQGLCSPWQNDFRECSCYYWASARPDYVNMRPGANGLSIGDNWFQKKRTGDYVPDDYVDPRLVLYDDLFGEWEKWIRFQIGGTDAPWEDK